MDRMNGRSFLRAAVVGVAMVLTAGSAFADKPSWAGEGKHRDGGPRHEERRPEGRAADDGRGGATIAFSFGSDDRRIAREYYGAQIGKGNCPPGLAKKGNGCQPPGQAKKWRIGQPLARDIQFYDVPYELRVRLPAPPPNHRYVQVAGDILMIAVGSSMVVDAMEDLLR